MRAYRPPVPLTPIDDRIMQGMRARWRYPLNHWYQYHDRRDAWLMLSAQEVCQFGPSSLEIDGIQCKGWSNGSYKQVDEL